MTVAALAFSSAVLGFFLGALYQIWSVRPQKVSAEMLPVVAACAPPPPPHRDTSTPQRVSEYAPKPKRFLHLKPRGPSINAAPLQGTKTPLKVGQLSQKSERWVNETSTDGATRRHREPERVRKENAGLAASTSEGMQASPRESATPLPSISWGKP